MWEVATGGRELYPGLGPLQIILQVSQHGQRPEVPGDAPPALAALMQRCWSPDPTVRPTAAAIVEELRQLLVALWPASPGRAASQPAPPPAPQPAPPPETP